LIYALKKILSDYKDNDILFHNPGLKNWGFFLIFKIKISTKAN